MSYGKKSWNATKQNFVWNPEKSKNIPCIRLQFGVHEYVWVCLFCANIYGICKGLKRQCFELKNKFAHSDLKTRWSTKEYYLKRTGKFWLVDFMRIQRSMDRWPFKINKLQIQNIDNWRRLIYIWLAFLSQIGRFLLN